MFRVQKCGFWLRKLDGEQQSFAHTKNDRGWELMIVVIACYYDYEWNAECYED